MPRKRSSVAGRRPHYRGGPLTEDQEDALTSGLVLHIMPGASLESLFGSEEAARQAWQDHRDRIMAEWMADPHLQPGSRPHGWWLFESPEGRRPHSGAWGPRPFGWMDEAVRLLELGELTEEEFETLDARARSADGVIRWSDEELEEWYRERRGEAWCG